MFAFACCFSLLFLSYCRESQVIGEVFWDEGGAEEIFLDTKIRPFQRGKFLGTHWATPQYTKNGDMIRQGLKELVHATLERWGAFRSDASSLEPKTQTWVQNIYRCLSPTYHDEFEGLSAGSGVSVEELALYNFFADYRRLSRGVLSFIGSTRLHLQSPEPTMFLALHQVDQPDGWLPGAPNTVIHYINHETLNGSSSFSSLGWPGMIGTLVGRSSHGLVSGWVQSDNTPSDPSSGGSDGNFSQRDFSQRDFSQRIGCRWSGEEGCTKKCPHKPLPIGFISRAILENMHSIESVTNFFGEHSALAPYNVLVGLPPRKKTNPTQKNSTQALIVEAADAPAVIRWVDDGYALATHVFHSRDDAETREDDADRSYFSLLEYARLGRELDIKGMAHELSYVTGESDVFIVMSRTKKIFRWSQQGGMVSLTNHVCSFCS